MHVELVLPRTLIVLYLADLRQTDSGLQHDLVEEERVEFDAVFVAAFVRMQREGTLRFDRLVYRLGLF
jgi:hypothetical protein